MNVFRTSLLFCCLTALFSGLFAQAVSHQAAIDSLKRKFSTVSKPAEKAGLLAEIAYAFRYPRPDSAIYYGNQVAVVDAESTCPMCWAKGFEAMGTAYRQLGDYNGALGVYRKAIGLYRAQKQYVRIAAVMDNIGLIYRKQGDYSAALGQLQQSLDIRTMAQDTIGMARTWACFGKVYMDQGYEQDARDEFNRALGVFDRNRLLYEKASALNDLGKTFLKDDDTKTAVQYHLEAVRIWRDLGDQDQVADAYASFVAVYLQKENYSKAIEYADKALEIFVPRGKKADFAPVFLQKGQALQAQEKYEDALAAYTQAYRAAHEVGIKSLELDACMRAQAVCGVLNKPEEAEKYRMLAATLKKELGQ